jgi:hypothetical protein
MRRATLGFVLLVVAGLLSVAGAVQQSTTAQGRAYVGGGVTDDERLEMQAQRDRYSLWVLTAARKSGAYLSNVHVVITDMNKTVVFDAPIDGPWLFVDLPLGRYTVQATYRGETQSRVTTIHQGDHHQAIFYFDTGDTTSVSSDMPPR